MKKMLMHFLMAAAMIAPVVAYGQAPSLQRLEGTWIFRATFEGAPAPVYVGTAQFSPDGKLSGPPVDQTGGPTVGEWIRAGDREFAFTYLTNSYDKGGVFSGTFRVRGMMKVADDGVTASGRTKFEVVDPTGKVVVSSTSIFTGARMVVETF